MEKQRAKAARKQQRKAEKASGINPDDSEQSITVETEEQQEGNESL